MKEWQPINTAPKDGTPILIYAPDTYKEQQIYVVIWDETETFPTSGVSYGWTEAGGEGYEKFEPCFWMPLPQPPSETPGQRICADRGLLMESDKTNPEKFAFTDHAQLIIAKALAYAIHAIDSFPSEAQEREDRQDMACLLNNLYRYQLPTVKHVVEFYTGQELDTEDHKLEV